MSIWRTREATMKSSTAQSMQVFYMSLLCLLTLHIVTGNDIVDSTTEMGADADTRVTTGLPAAREGIYSFPRKINREIPKKEDAPGRRRKRAAGPPLKNSEVIYSKPNTVIVIFLVFLLIFITLILVFFYKLLNRESGGEYSLPKLVDGARELAQNMVRPVQGRLGELLRTRRPSRDEERGEEEDDDEEGGEKESERDAESPAEDERREEDSDDDYSSMEGFEPQGGRREKGREGKRASQEKKREEKKGEVTDEEEEEEEKEVEGDENRQGGQTGEGLLADLKDFSGSAIWQEEKSEGEKDSCDLTEL